MCVRVFVLMYAFIVLCFAFFLSFFLSVFLDCHVSSGPFVMLILMYAFIVLLLF